MVTVKLRDLALGRQSEWINFILFYGSDVDVDLHREDEDDEVEGKGVYNQMCYTKEYQE